MSREPQYPDITIANYKKIDSQKLTQFEGETVADTLLYSMQLRLEARTVDLDDNPSEHGKIFNAAWSLGYTHVITGELAWIFLRERNQTYKVVWLGEHNIFDMSEADLFRLLRPNLQSKIDGSV